LTTPKLPSNMYAKRRPTTAGGRDVRDHHRHAHEAAAAERAVEEQGDRQRDRELAADHRDVPAQRRHRLSRKISSPAMRTKLPSR
jgi:hypothetical protein